MAAAKGGPPAVQQVNPAPPVAPAPARPPAAANVYALSLDRAVWPATWGNLPERGFEAPRPEDLPPSIAGLPAAMGEAGRGQPGPRRN
jgi:hypothetical protein